jgi:integrase
MPGSLRERGPRVWELRTSLGKGPDGKYRQVSRTYRGPRKEAEKALRRLVVEAEAGKLGHLHQRATTGDVLERWFALRSPDYSPTTVRTYRMYLDNHILPALGKVPLDKLTTDRLDAFYGALRARGLSISSVRQCHAIVHVGLAQAKRWKLVQTNEASDVTLPTKRQKELDPPTVDEALSMVRAVDEKDPEFATWLFVIASTGARRGEMCGLRWPRVDFTEGTLTIARAVIALRGIPAWEEKDTKTHAVRDVILPTVAVMALQRHRKFMEERAERAGTILKPDAFVFSRRIDGSEPWLPDTTTQRFRRLRKKLKLRYFRQHDLRHMVATILMAEMDPVNVAKRLGWSDPSMLFRVYGHASVEQDRKAARIMGKMLSAKKALDPPKKAER